MLKTYEENRIFLNQLSNTWQNWPLDYKREVMRHLARTNLHYLFTVVLKRSDADADLLPHQREWIYQRCREIYNAPDNHLDLWSRGHYKSSIITLAKTIQDILRSYGEKAPDPKEYTFGIFSHTRTIASGFVSQIKREFESNDLLRSLFPDICWENPKRDAPVWTNDRFTVKGASNPKEATVEGWGLVDSQPIGKHFDIRLYDDTVTPTSVSTPEQINKTTDAWRMSLNLRSTTGRARYIGTRYALRDTYSTIMKEGGVTVRLHPATNTGKLDGKPVFWSEEVYKEMLNMGTKTAACQLLQNPQAATEIGFNKNDFRTYNVTPDPDELNLYLLCDPAGTKSKKSDYTAAAVIGLGKDRNYYILELIRDKLRLTERAQLIFDLHRQYDILEVGYETYGLNADIEYMEVIQDQQNYHFDIIPLGGNQLSKTQRIEKLVPLFEKHRIWFPKEQFRTLYDDRRVDVVKEFHNEEFLNWPVSGGYDDVLDMIARIVDPALDAEFPKKHQPYESQISQQELAEKYSWIP